MQVNKKEKVSVVFIDVLHLKVCALQVHLYKHSSLYFMKSRQNICKLL